MNILFTCAGRRNYLINYFKEALAGKGKVFATDMQLDAPALVDADFAIKVPAIYDEAYIPKLKSIIVEHKINVVISLNDLELPILSRHKAAFEELGTKVIVSDENVINIAFDKWETNKFLDQHGINYAKTYIDLDEAILALESGDLHFPLVVKPRWGSGSIGIDFPQTLDELKLVYEIQRVKIERTILKEASLNDLTHSILIQQKLPGNEFGMDILNDFKGNYVGTFVRQKLSMRSGETDKAISIIDANFEALGRKLGEALGHIGNLDCDVFEHDGQLYVLELNPRFGGGYPFSHEAGINTAAIYLEWIAGRENIEKFNNYKAGVQFSKCDRLLDTGLKLSKEQVVDRKIWLSSPHMGGSEQKYVNEAFETNWIAPLGPHVDNFETDLATYTKTKHAAALSSGTAAIHLALIMLGVKAGDEVICQTMTFSASANPIAYLGATPVFVDSEKDTWNMCPVMLNEAIKDRIAQGKTPKAIIPVHLYGMPAQMDKIMAVARNYNIPVVEDAAEALGSSIKNKAMGSYGELGVLSFNGNKIITTSGGGALLSNDEDHIKKARFLATQARDAAPHYQHSEIGYNYRMSNISAGIGRGQMEVLDKHIQNRRNNFDTYKTAFANIEGISLLEEPKGYRSNRWLSTILIDPTLSNGITKEDLMEALAADNIESRPLWKPMHLQPVFSASPYYGNGTSEYLFQHGLCLPSGSNLTKDHLDRVCTIIKHTFAEASEAVSNNSTSV